MPADDVFPCKSDQRIGVQQLPLEGILDDLLHFLETRLPAEDQQPAVECVPAWDQFE